MLLWVLSRGGFPRAAFQQLEVDYFVGPPTAHSLQVHRTDLHEVPILRMYGVTEAGMPPDPHFPLKRLTKEWRPHAAFAG